MEPETAIISKQEIGSASQQAVSKVVEATQEVLHGDFSSITSIFVKHVVPASIGVLAIIVAYFLAKFISRIVSDPIRQRVDETLGKFVGKLVFYAIMLGSIVCVVSSQGIDVTSFAAILAATGFAVGLAFQGTLSNFASGILLLVFRPFKVGDKVVIAGMTGTVFEIDLFSTALDTYDNRRIILPNSSIAGSTIENMTHHAHRRIEVAVGVAYDCDLGNSRAALTQAVESLGDFLVTDENRQCQVILTNLGPHSVDWVVRAWVQTKDIHLAKEILTVAIKEHLDAFGLQIPFPQLDIHWSNHVSNLGQSPQLTEISGSSNDVPTFSPRRRVA